MQGFAHVDDVPELTWRSDGDRRSATAAVLAGVVPAAGARRAWPVLDVVVAVAVATAPVVLTPWTLLLLPVVLVAAAAGLLRTGRTPAHRLLRLRTVDPATGAPPTLRAVLGGRLLTADLRAGTDPLRVTPTAAQPLRATPVDPWAPERARTGTHLVLLLDDGTVVPVPAPTLLGRRPADPTGEYLTVQVTDLSRTLSRNHVAVRPHADGLQVRDLGSANGTAVAVPGGALQMLAPHADVLVPVGARLAIGDRVLHVAVTGQAATSRAVTA